MRRPSVRSCVMQPALPPDSGSRIGARACRFLVPALCLGLIVTSLWAGATSYYLIFHDEMLARFVSQQSAMQYAYEERLGALQLELDRSANERIVARNGLESRLATIAERLGLIEKRHGILSGLAGVTAEVAPPVEPVAAALSRTRKPIPMPDMPGLRTTGDDRAELPGRMSRIERTLDAVLGAQAQAASEIGARAERNAERYRALMQQAGIPPARLLMRAGKPPSDIGGPLVPVGSDAFAEAVAEARASIDEETQWRRAAAAMPLRRPVRENAVQTSSFGTRLDPFTRGLAMHTGVDFRAETGAPTRATAAGRVISAEYSGGYGNMVEIDHGYGLTTRYAHLSGYAVSPGQRVEPSQVVGYVGSTGRSTGSHLHYETRIDGEAVDPARFLRASAQLVFAD